MWYLPRRSLLRGRRSRQHRNSGVIYQASFKGRTMPRYLALLAAVSALAVSSCNNHSLSLDLTPNPLIVGLVDTQATIHARAVARGFGKVPIGALQFSVYNAADSMLASQTESVDQSIQASPLGIVVNKDFIIPINGAIVGLSG